MLTSTFYLLYNDKKVRTYTNRLQLPARLETSPFVKGTDINRRLACVSPEKLC
ncbi:MAG: hypothetical protein OXL96_17105 [Candidatus Poribacteria bacterium]|nr:hypothetical protein [Candidatus Poribacteria bacterium]